jgi:hypothetical protein
MHKYPMMTALVEDFSFGGSSLSRPSFDRRLAS